MRRVAFASSAVIIFWLAVMAVGSAQQPAPLLGAPDPRVGLKAGFRDAGVASLNMVLVSTLPKPDGFFDPGQPAGVASPPEGAAAAGVGSAAPPSMPAVGARRRSGLRELGPRVQGHASFHGELPRLQHL